MRAQLLRKNYSRNFSSIRSGPRTANGANKRLVLHVRLRCGSPSITTPVSLPANAFDVRSVLYGQVSLATVNQINVIHEAMTGCKNLKMH